MKLSELLKLFSKNKIKLLQHGKRHDIYFSPITGKKIPGPTARKGNRRWDTAKHQEGRGA